MTTTRADGKPFKGYLIFQPHPEGTAAYMPTAGEAVDLILTATCSDGSALLIIERPDLIGLPCAAGTSVPCTTRDEADRSARALLYACDWTRAAEPEACPNCGTTDHWRASCGLAG